MEVFKTIKTLQHTLSLFSPKDTLGLVPTMGALHQGHLSIVKRAKRENSRVLVSIFVNPTQFDKKEDLINYPSTLQKDLELLEAQHCDFVFIPSADEMYQHDLSTESFQFKGLDKVMEGKFRQGHFDGVATIVKKLFMITAPDKAYFGEKDYQQLLIIKKMVSLENLPIEIVPCQIYREKNGLAMSSRNTRLNREQQNAAPMIYQILVQSKILFADHDLGSIKTFVKTEFEQNEHLDLEYFEIADKQTLNLCDDFIPGKKYQALIAVFTGKVRLIDNIALN